MKRETDAEARASYENAFTRELMNRPIDPYDASNLGELADDGGVEGLGDPLGDFVGNLKLKLQDLDFGLKIAAAASVAGAVGVILMLVTMKRRY